MPGILSRAAGAVRRYFAQMQAFLTEQSDSLNEANWRILRPMSLVYMGFMLLYRLVACPVAGIPKQTMALNVGIALHLVVMLWIFSFRGVPSKTVTNLSVSVFAFEILAISAHIGLGAYPGEAAFLFPLVIILMTQIYTRPLGYTVVELGVSISVFLTVSYHVKTPDVFLLDALSVAVALMTASVAQVGLMSFKLQAYETRKSLMRMCELDAMTGVNNKATFRYLVDERLKKRKYGSSVTFAVCDLDGFKKVNDSYGHLVGDEVLKAFSARLRTVADQDENMLVGRFGGDEFVIFTENCAEDAARRRLENLCVIRVPQLTVTCSVGAVQSCLPGVDFDRLFGGADRNAYSSKQSSGGRVLITQID